MTSYLIPPTLAKYTAVIEYIGQQYAPDKAPFMSIEATYRLLEQIAGSSLDTYSFGQIELRCHNSAIYRVDGTPRPARMEDLHECMRYFRPGHIALVLMRRFPTGELVSNDNVVLTFCKNGKRTASITVKRHMLNGHCTISGHTIPHPCNQHVADVIACIINDGSTWRASEDLPSFMPDEALHFIGALKYLGINVRG